MMTNSISYKGVSIHKRTKNGKTYYALDNTFKLFATLKAVYKEIDTYPKNYPSTKDIINDICR